jgi:hypothetical protein
MRQLALSLFLILCASLMPVHAADSSSTNQREALPLPPITIYHLEARPAYQRMAEISKPDGMPGPPEPLPDSSRPPR